MDHREYREILNRRFGGMEYIPSLTAEMFYEEEFRIEWGLAKLKQFTFLAWSEEVTEELLREYSERCVKYAVSHYSGMPRGVQNGVVSYNVMAGGRVTEGARRFAESRPKKHFSAFEFPVLADLSKERIFYFRGTPLWGALYYGHFRRYAEGKFSI